MKSLRPKSLDIAPAMWALTAAAGLVASIAFVLRLVGGLVMAREKGSASPSFCECGAHAFASLTLGYVVIVSPEDAHQLNYHWHVNTCGGRYLTVVRSKTISPRMQRTVILSREIMDAASGEMIDHENLNPLDNTRGNMRRASRSQNQWNTTVRRDSASGVKGVRRTKGGRFIARIKLSGRFKHLGTFDSIADAHSAYDTAARHYRRDFARSL